MEVLVQSTLLAKTNKTLPKLSQFSKNKCKQLTEIFWHNLLPLYNHIPAPTLDSGPQWNAQEINLEKEDKWVVVVGGGLKIIVVELQVYKDQTIAAVIPKW